MIFSERLGYVQDDRPEVFEDAPAELRFYFTDKILPPLTYIDKDSRYKNITNAPLGSKFLIEDLCSTLKQVPDSNYTDSWHCNEILTELIKVCEWYYFYDIVERIGTLIIQMQKWYTDNIEWNSKFGIETYIFNINDMFKKFKIGWRLDDNCILQKNTPLEFLEKENNISKNLVSKYEAARKQFNKATQFIRRFPLDPENSIKEIVSSVESVARIKYPSAKTLGDAVKCMRRDGLPPLLLDVIEKYYGFANAEPGVRHGGRTTSNIAIEEAELCLHFGMAIIRYLLADSGDWADFT